MLKEACIFPIVKKSGINSADVCSYLDISNLPIVLKLLESIVARQLFTYLQPSDLLPPSQSGFPPGQSMERAVLQVLSDLLLAVKTSPDCKVLTVSTSII
jgi:hypothetical protein